MQPYALCLDSDGLCLRNGNSTVRVDFIAGSNAHRRLHGGGRTQPLAKAIGLKIGNIVPSVLDCTAGLGTDAFVLASLGCKVFLCERSETVHSLLQDGLMRAKAGADNDVARIVGRMQLQQVDAKNYLQVMTEPVDVIYLDPMFPERAKKAAVKKGMVAFHALVGADEDADALLPLALDKAIYRVVVKRSRHAPFLGNLKPSFSFEGESTRFDIYARQSMLKA